jgi:hypothetical protein
LDGQASSTSHFVLAMVQLPERIPLHALVTLRKELKLPPTFEFKYHKTTTAQKDRFFKAVLAVPFRVRAVAVSKANLLAPLLNMTPQKLTIELIVRLTLRASELDIANEILIVDGATPTFCRDLRVHFTELCKQETRVRPFKRIIGGNSKNEDGLQVADMIAGALRLHAMGISNEHFRIVSTRIVDLWNLP